MGGKMLSENALSPSEDSATWPVIWKSQVGCEKGLVVAAKINCGTNQKTQNYSKGGRHDPN